MENDEHVNIKHNVDKIVSVLEWSLVEYLRRFCQGVN